MVGSTHYVLGPFAKDSDLRRHGEKIAGRGGKNANRRAAVARKLSVLLHHLWVSGGAYGPLYNATRIVPESGRLRTATKQRPKEAMILVERP